MTLCEVGAVRGVGLRLAVVAKLGVLHDDHHSHLSQVKIVFILLICDLCLSNPIVGR